MKRSTLLICITPGGENVKLNEIAFFKIVNPIAPVLNIRLIAADAQYKAFVEVENKIMAEKVISAINQTLCEYGKIKVFISHKKSIHYDKKLNQILDELLYEEQQKLNQENPNKLQFKRDFGSNANISLTNKLENPSVPADTCVYEKINQTSAHNLPYPLNFKLNYKGRNIETPVIYGNDGKANKNPPNSSSLAISDFKDKNLIKITNNDSLALKSTIISKIFGQFGPIVKRKLVSRVWIIQYYNEAAVRKAITWLNKSYSKGYRLVELSNDSRSVEDIKNIGGEEAVISDVDELQAKNRGLKFVEATSKSLKIIDPLQNICIKKLCKIIASCCIPLRIIEAYSINDMRIFFIIDFSCSEECEVVQKFIDHEFPELVSSLIPFETVC